MANTYTLISSVAVGSGGAANIDFTSIPQTYTDLVLKLSGRRNSTTTRVDIKLNNSALNGSYIRLYDASGTAGSDSSSFLFTQVPDSTITANTFSNVELYIPNYTSSNYKSISQDQVRENNSATNTNSLMALLWSDTSAINQITLIPFSSGTFDQYSTAYLYGISNA